MSDFGVAQPIPVDIERIADVRLALDIVPVPGLRRDRDIEAYLSADRKTIYVDENAGSGPVLSRYRFTIAHEIGHWYLHQDLYEAAVGADCDFADFIYAIPEKDWSWYEWQARAFAGLVLVPRDPLALEVQAAVSHAKASGFASIDLGIEAHRGRVAERVSKEFQVSPEVILWRGGYDELWPKA